MISKRHKQAFQIITLAVLAAALVALLVTPEESVPIGNSDGRRALLIRANGNKALLEIQSLALTGNKTFFENASDSLQELHNNLEDEKRLAARKTPQARTLHLELLSEEFGALKTLAARTLMQFEAIQHLKCDALEIHERFMALQNMYAGALTDQAAKEIKTNAGEPQISGSLKKIVSNGDFSHLISDGLVAFLKACNRDEKALQAVGPILDELLARIHAQQSSTQDQRNLERLGLLHTLGLKFQKNLASMNSALKELGELDQERIVQGNACARALSVYAEESMERVRVPTPAWPLKAGVFSITILAGIAAGGAVFVPIRHALRWLRLRKRTVPNLMVPATVVSNRRKTPTSYATFRIRPLSQAEQN